MRSRTGNQETAEMAMTGVHVGPGVENADHRFAGEILAREALRLSEAVHRQELIALNSLFLTQALTRQGKAAAAKSCGQAVRVAAAALVSTHRQR